MFLFKSPVLKTGIEIGVCRPLAQQEFFTKPKFSHVIEPGDCLAAPCDVILLDMYTLQIKDLEVSFGLGLCLWCLVEFKLPSLPPVPSAGTEGSVSLHRGDVRHLPRFHGLVRRLFPEPGSGGHRGGAEHGPELRVQALKRTFHSPHLFVLAAPLLNSSTPFSFIVVSNPHPWSFSSGLRTGSRPCSCWTSRLA